MSYCQVIDTMPTARQALHRAYHDHDYGFPIEDDNALFGRLLLEINQAGLSWETILKKEASLRRAYSNFDITTVAAYTEADRARLLADAGIIRNRLKVNAAIENARIILGPIKSRVGAAVQKDVSLHGRRNRGRVPAEHRLPAGRAQPGLPSVSAGAANPAQVAYHGLLTLMFLLDPTSGG
jgi:3-methyladenine DNA glycosylase Tag